MMDLHAVIESRLNPDGSLQVNRSRTPRMLACSEFVSPTKPAALRLLFSRSRAGRLATSQQTYATPAWPSLTAMRQERSSIRKRASDGSEGVVA